MNFLLNQIYLYEKIQIKEKNLILELMLTLEQTEEGGHDIFAHWSGTVGWEAAEFLSESDDREEAEEKTNAEADQCETPSVGGE